MTMITSAVLTTDKDWRQDLEFQINEDAAKIKDPLDRRTTLLGLKTSIACIEVMNELQSMNLTPNELYDAFTEILAAGALAGLSVSLPKYKIGTLPQFTQVCGQRFSVFMTAKAEYLKENMVDMVKSSVEAKMGTIN